MNDALQTYLETAIWASTNEEGESLEYLNFDPDSFSTEARKTASKELEDFLDSALEIKNADSLSDEELAHNFWLLRNRHGAGFWDLGLGELGDQLHALAVSFGTSDVYVNGEALEIA